VYNKPFYSNFFLRISDYTVMPATVVFDGERFFWSYI